MVRASGRAAPLYIYLPIGTAHLVAVGAFWRPRARRPAIVPSAGYWRCAVVAVIILLFVVTVLGFSLAYLALRQVRPAWFRMRASVGRLISFSLEMDRRHDTDVITPPPPFHDDSNSQVK
jgi:hypothetical protein